MTFVITICKANKILWMNRDYSVFIFGETNVNFFGKFIDWHTKNPVIPKTFESGHLCHAVNTNILFISGYIFSLLTSIRELI
jgi:hypothetical protein